MARLPLASETWGKVTDGRVSRELIAFLRGLGVRIIVDTFTWDPGTVAADSALDTTLTAASYPSLTGLRVGQYVGVTSANMPTGLYIQGAWVAADDTLTIRLYNLTAGGLNMTSTAFTFFGVLV